MKDINDQLEVLLDKGFAFFPNLKLNGKNFKKFNLDKYRNRTHIKDTELHKAYLKQHNIKKILIPELVKKANQL